MSFENPNMKKELKIQEYQQPGSSEMLIAPFLLYT